MLLLMLILILPVMVMVMVMVSVVMMMVIGMMWSTRMMRKGPSVAAVVAKMEQGCGGVRTK